MGDEQVRRVQDHHERGFNVKLEQVWPDGRWSATVMQTQSEYNHLAACMQDESVSASLYRRQADAGNPAAMAQLGRMYDLQAVQWYRRGAEARNGQAMASLAYDEGTPSCWTLPF